MKEVTIKLNHFNVSMIKSGMRIVGCLFGLFGSLAVFFILMPLAEALGIREEVVDA